MRAQLGFHGAMRAWLNLMTFVARKHCRACCHLGVCCRAMQQCLQLGCVVHHAACCPAGLRLSPLHPSHHPPLSQHMPCGPAPLSGRDWLGCRYAEKGMTVKEGGLSNFGRKLKEMMEHATQFPEEYSKMTSVQKKVREGRG